MKIINQIEIDDYIVISQLNQTIFCWKRSIFHDSGK